MKISTKRPYKKVLNASRASKFAHARNRVKYDQEGNIINIRGKHEKTNNIDSKNERTHYRNISYKKSCRILNKLIGKQINEVRKCLKNIELPPKTTFEEYLKDIITLHTKRDNNGNIIEQEYYLFPRILNEPSRIEIFYVHPDTQCLCKTPPKPKRKYVSKNTVTVLTTYKGTYLAQDEKSKIWYEYKSDPIQAQSDYYHYKYLCKVNDRINADAAKVYKERHQLSSKELKQYQLENK